MILGYCGVDHENDDVTLSLTPDSIVALYASRHPKCQKLPCTGTHGMIGWDAHTVFAGLFDTITGQREVHAVVYEVTDEFEPQDEKAARIHGYVVNGLAALRDE